MTSSRAQHLSIAGLRISVGIIYFWFGSLKLAGYDPVAAIIRSSFPILATPFGNQVLGGFEIAIGLGLLVNIFPAVVNDILLLHLVGTFAVFFLAPAMMFEPHFPILSLSGEFVFKNLTLAMAGLVVLAHRRH